MNRTEEKSIIKRFQDNFPDFPTGQLSYEDRPDFIVFGNKNVGIEITQIFRDQRSTRGSKLRAIENRHRQLGENIIEALNEMAFHSLVLTIDTANHADLTRVDVRQVANACLPHVINHAAQLNNLERCSIINYGQLPEEIDQLNLFLNTELTESQFIESGGTALPNLTTEDIQFVLAKKNKELAGYKNCDEYWLIIKEGSFIADSFGDIHVNSDLLDSHFDRVFLIRQSNSQIVQLK